jgi:drug/metabolite transporter (DMT)-like permease
MSLSLSALALVLACSVAWAGVDLSRKLLVRDIPPAALLFLLTVGVAPGFVVWMLAAGVDAPRPAYWAPALGSVMLNLAANLLYLEGMRIAPLSVTVPLLSLTPAFATLLAVPLLGEWPSLRGAAGILMVIAGAVWLHWQPRPSSGPAGQANLPGKPRALRGALLVALTALFWSLAVPLDKLALKHAAVPLHGTVLTAGVAGGVLLVLLAQRRLGEVGQARRAPGVLVLGLAVSALALGLQLLALPRVYVGTIETLKRGVGNGLALIFGRLFFAEAVTLSKVLALALMAAGVGCILDFGF